MFIKENILSCVIRIDRTPGHLSESRGMIFLMIYFDLYGTNTMIQHISQKINAGLCKSGCDHAIPFGIDHTQQGLKSSRCKLHNIILTLSPAVDLTFQIFNFL